MSGADSLLPPESYAWWVPTLGGVLLLLAAAWIVVVLLATRRSRAPKPAPLDDAAREGYQREVDDALRAYHDGELDLRALHLRLARLMREVASERTGRDVRSWTRGDIAGDEQVSHLGELLALWEEPSFARRSDAEAQQAADRAREVIREW